MPPTVPINHYFGPKNQSENKTQVLFYYPMLTYSGRVLACFEHSNLFKVNEPELRPRREIVEGRVSSPFEKRDEPFFREEGAVSLDTPRSETLGVPRRARVAPPPFRGSRRILPLSQEQERASGRRERANQCSPVGGGPASLGPKEGRTPLSAPLQGSTTSFLTATTLIYAIGAGITAAAGTRLALQLFLVKGFELYSFQLRDSGRVPYRYLLSLPPRVGIG